MRLKRLPYRNGFGVHSPFAYEFLMQVAYERAAFYAFPALQRRYPTPHTLKGKRLLKCRQFLFRLANFIRPHTIRICGTLSEAAHDYLLAACLNAQITHETTLPRRCAEPQDELAVIAPDTPASLALSIAANPATPHSACLFYGIYSSKQSLSSWQHATSNSAAAVTFDLHHFGLIFYDHTKPTQHYIINF